MGRAKRKRSRVEPGSPLQGPRTWRKLASGKTRWTRLALLLGTLAVATAISVVIWSENEPHVATEAVESGYEILGDVVYVHNRTCAMSGSPIAEKDLGRFESRVSYDGPIERFRGKTLVFNQCCANCIESFPKKWAAERDQIMANFGLTQDAPE